MKTLVAYTPAQIRACGAMLEALEGKHTPSELIAFARGLKDPKIQNQILKHRLILPPPKDQPPTGEEFLFAVGWQTLRIWNRIRRELVSRNVTTDEVKNFIRKERRTWLEQPKTGKVTP